MDASTPGSWTPWGFVEPYSRVPDEKRRTGFGFNFSGLYTLKGYDTDRKGCSIGGRTQEAGYITGAWVGRVVENGDRCESAIS